MTRYTILRLPTHVQEERDLSKQQVLLAPLAVALIIFEQLWG